jgi:hypothetical protein
MRKPRTLVQIPRDLASEIDRIVGQRQRATFVIDLVERELRRRRQLEALRAAAGSWTDENHPELAKGADSWVRKIRQEAAQRLEKIDQQRAAE